MSVEHTNDTILLGLVKVFPDHFKYNTKSGKRSFRSVHGAFNHSPQIFFGLAMHFMENSLAQIDGNRHH
ncbi:hypothetical protein D3C86_2163830 [compost metagenome]